MNANPPKRAAGCPTSNSTAPITCYCGDFGHRTLIDRVISLAKKRLPGKLLRRTPFDWGRVLCGPRNMLMTPLWWYLGWWCALDGRFRRRKGPRPVAKSGSQRACVLSTTSEPGDCAADDCGLADDRHAERGRQRIASPQVGRDQLQGDADRVVVADLLQLAAVPRDRAHVCLNQIDPVRQSSPQYRYRSVARPPTHRMADTGSATCR